MNAIPKKSRQDRVRRQALQLLATTACSWNLADHGPRTPSGQALAGSKALRIAQAPHRSNAL